MMKNNGCLLIAFGEAHLVLSLISIKSLKKHHPELKVQLITNIAINLDVFDFWNSGSDIKTFLEMDTDMNRAIKTDLIAYTAFDNTLFIDSDTLIAGDINNIFEFSKQFDIGIKLNWRPQMISDKSQFEITEELSVGDFPHWNSGVIFFTQNEQSRLFFATWHQNYAEMGSPYDQPSLAKTIYSMPDLRFISLDERWNSSGPVFNRRKWSRWVKIFHYTNMITPHIFKEVQKLSHILELQNIKTDNAVALLRSRIKHRRNRLGFFRSLLISIILRYNCVVTNNRIY